MKMMSILFFIVCTTMAHVVMSLSPEQATSQQQQQQQRQQAYAEARSVRARMGHDASKPLYQSLLKKNKGDLTAALRLAAGDRTPERHDTACPLHVDKIRELRQLLDKVQYDNTRIRELFGIDNSSKLSQASGPVYVKPAAAVGDSSSPMDCQSTSQPLQCLVTLFLLGIAVPEQILIETLGEKAVHLLQELGLTFPCENEPEIIVPFVHIFPMDVTNVVDDSKSTNLILATDLHPNVLSCTTVGTCNDGAVMYIGPDSLALVQHIPLRSYAKTKSHSLRILDLCTGSGVQALATLLALQGAHSPATALCVDCNPRALRFTQFNAALNGLAGDQVRTLRGDLITGMTIEVEGDGTGRSIVDALIQGIDDGSPTSSRFDIVLCNPPFIPVPPNDKDILRRYGLFSSGGADGEDVLRGVMDISSQVIKRRNGLIAIVSEFMNPPRTDTDTSTASENDYNAALLHRMKAWWSQSQALNECPGGRGVLFTNQFPVNAETYATRRADTHTEFDTWLRHLSELTITHVSPGLLFMRTDTVDADSPRLVLFHKLVPKSDAGSIWTPSNKDAVTFTMNVLSTEEVWN